MCFAATVLAVGCGGKSDEATGVVQVSAASVPGISSEQPGPSSPAPLVHLELIVKEIDVRVVPIASTGNDDDKTAGVDHGIAHEDVDDGGQWVTIAGERQIDLYSGTTTEILLGDATTPAGQITQTRLVLERDATLWIGVQQIMVKCPSCSTSGLKLISQDAMIVPPGGTALLKLSFDLGMLAEKHDGDFQLGPVVRLAASARP
jgi:hypothetical protein